MTQSEFQCLKDNVGKLVEIETTDGEWLIAKVLFVLHSEEFDEHELLYEVISSSKLDSYSHLETSGGYVLDFGKILSVREAPRNAP